MPWTQQPYAINRATWKPRKPRTALVTYNFFPQKIHRPFYWALMVTKLCDKSKQNDLYLKCILRNNQQVIKHSFWYPFAPMKLTKAKTSFNKMKLCWCQIYCNRKPCVLQKYQNTEVKVFFFYFGPSRTFMKGIMTRQHKH